MGQNSSTLSLGGLYLLKTFDREDITFEPIKDMNVEYCLAGGRLFRKDEHGEWYEIPRDQWPVHTWCERCEEDSLDDS